MKIVYRNDLKCENLEYSRLVKFLYKTTIGRICLKLITNKRVANCAACFLNSKISGIIKDKVIKKHNIDMNKFVDIKYDTYNKFFTRKYKQQYLNVDNNIDSFISPCDSKLMILKIDEHNEFNIKHSMYKLEEIINNDVVNEFRNGYLLIFRLDVNDYHRYCYIDDGVRSDYQYIDGKFHTVQPIVYDTYKVFHQNAREWCVLETNNFDKIIEVEVGALLVGKIVNNKNIKSYKKGDEKGYFEFGGSTILLFVKDGVVNFDLDILKNSNEGNETIVKYGERIGVKNGRIRKIKNGN